MNRIPLLAAVGVLLACGQGLDVLPSAPTSVQAIAGNASVTVSWNPPDKTGGRPILQYVVTASPGGASQATAGPVTMLAFTGLTPGFEYTFTVAAINSAGTGPASAPSNAVAVGRQQAPHLDGTNPPP